MTNQSAKWVAMAAEQAAGLRALAELITRNPALADFTFPLSHLDAVLTEYATDARAALETFYRAAAASGASVAIDNLPHQCEVSAHFGPVVVTMCAKADLMAGEQARVCKYEPLTVPGGIGA